MSTPFIVYLLPSDTHDSFYLLLGLQRSRVNPALSFPLDRQVLSASAAAGSPHRATARGGGRWGMQHAGFGRSGCRGGVGSLVGSLVGAWGAWWWWKVGGGVADRGDMEGRDDAAVGACCAPATQPNRNVTRTQTALRAREPRARTQTATRRNRRTKIGSQITACGNSESRRQSRDQTPTQVLIRDVELPLRKPAYVP
jgi:hypothetical protein